MSKTVQVGITSSLDDQSISRSGQSYPPTGSFTRYIDSALIYTSKYVSGSTYYIRNGLLRFDTSFLPKNAVITSATLRMVKANDNTNTNSRSLYVQWYNWNETDSDWTSSYSASASAGLSLTTLDSYANGTSFDLTLSNPDIYISRTGMTGLRLNISGTATPTGLNTAYIAEYSHSTYSPPQLIITYHSQDAISVNLSSNDTMSYKNASSWSNIDNPVASWHPTSTNLEATKSKNSDTTFTVRNAFVAFDTSTIPDDAVITGADLKVWVDITDNADARSIDAGWYNWTGVDSDHVHADLTPTAFTQTISTIAENGTRTFPLSNLTNINKSGLSKIRMTISGGKPTGHNYIVFHSYDHATNPAPQLVVRYDTGLEFDKTITIKSISTSSQIRNISYLPRSFSRNIIFLNSGVFSSRKRILKDIELQNIYEVFLSRILGRTYNRDIYIQSSGLISFVHKFIAKTYETLGRMG